MGGTAPDMNPVEDRREQWISPARRLGIRPLLRRIVPRHYIVEAVRDVPS